MALAIVAALSGLTGFLVVAALTQMVLLIAATAMGLRAVISESEVGFRTILGAISVYMIFGLLFTSLYVAIDRLQAGEFFVSRPALTPATSSSSASRPSRPPGTETWSPLGSPAGCWRE